VSVGIGSILIISDDFTYGATLSIY